MSKFINDAQFCRHLKEVMNEELIAAAEPVIAEAIAKVEVELRKRLGTMLIAMIDQNFTMDRIGPDLRIVIKQNPNP